MDKIVLVNSKFEIAYLLAVGLDPAFTRSRYIADKDCEILDYFFYDSQELIDTRSDYSTGGMIQVQKYLKALDFVSFQRRENTKRFWERRRQEENNTETAAAIHG